MGALGNMHSERGLTYYEVALSGHMYVLVLPYLHTMLTEFVQGTTVLSEGKEWNARREMN